MFYSHKRFLFKEKVSRIPRGTGKKEHMSKWREHCDGRTCWIEGESFERKKFHGQTATGCFEKSIASAFVLSHLNQNKVSEASLDKSFSTPLRGQRLTCSLQRTACTRAHPLFGFTFKSDANAKHDRHRRLHLFRNNQNICTPTSFSPHQKLR